MAGAELRLGPLLRYADGAQATVWVETDRPCEVEIACDTGAGGSSHTWRVAGHHYALVVVDGLVPGAATPYRVRLDGAQAWPEPGAAAPTVRTPDPAESVRVVFGSCRWAAKPDGDHDPVGPDALDTLSQQLDADGYAERPDVLLLLGDQVYADETSAATREWLATRRDLAEPPGAEVADYEEYTQLYYESWLDPEVRRLLASVPSCMIFDDHDVIDDWNTSEAWLTMIRAKPWWRERVLGGLMSYWVHQHLGNLSPAELETDKLYAAVRAAGDGAELLRDFAIRSDEEPGAARWSYRRDIGRTRILMVDSRAARVLQEDRRALLADSEMAWLREQALSGPGTYDHLLIGSSLPWLLPPAVHAAEGWNAALCAGGRGARWAGFAEKVRQAADLEHWAAFPRSFAELAELIAEVGRGAAAPASVLVLSGDVHHAYVAEPEYPADVRSKVAQLTCSPMHNSVPAPLKAGFRFGWSRAGRAIGRALARHGRLPEQPVAWKKTGGPWFGNQIMTLELGGPDSARLRLQQAGESGDARTARLRVADERELVSGPGA
ncbi:alkaline phosphatase family protein [Streptomyces sp. A7024]|uniref:Alkaline phosphatase family protein n=1 Tax=Streptomyces coryli TaxID=1128680 RepID=A0A6G4TU06_9ACTN|nr:alkaline phosphatase D family protein [Streptomyces coryli]NGN63354.1 alkaline phosphatase family protein [Streptomyces coryli]